MAVNAANTAVVVELADGSVHSQCVYVEEGWSAYNALEEVDLDFVWSSSIYGKFLEEVEGVASDPVSETYWSFWHVNAAGTGFVSSMVGVSDYEIEDEDDILGISYTEFDSSYNPINPPPFMDYKDICDNPINIDKVKAYYDNDDSIIGDGDDIKLKPGSEVLLVITIKNLNNDEDLEDVKVELEIEGIDDGDDLKEEEGSMDIDDNDKDEMELEFKVPYDASEGVYNAIITASGEMLGTLYTEVMEFEIEIEKDDDDMLADVPASQNVECGMTSTFEVEIYNIGSDDQEVSLTVENSDLGIDLLRTFSLEEEDSDIKTFTLGIPEDASGTYSLETKLSYSGESRTFYTNLYVVCSESGYEPASEDEADNGSEDEGLSSISGFTIQEDDDKDGVGYLVLLVLLNVILVVFVIWLFRK